MTVNMSREPDLFGASAPPAFSLGRLVECAERELRQRRRVYPRLIEQGSMSRAFADEEVAAMAAIIEELRKPRERWSDMDHPDIEALIKPQAIPVVLWSPGVPGLVCRWEATVNAWRYGIVGSMTYPGAPRKWCRLPPEPTT